MWWRTRPEVSRHLCGPGVTSGEFICSDANQTCYRARAASSFVSWESGLHCAHDLHVFQTQTLSWQNGLQNSSVGDSFMRPGLAHGRPWAEDSGWGEQYCRLAGEGSRSKAEASIGPHPLPMLRSSSGNAIHLSLVVMCQLQTRKGYSRDLLWSCGWGVTTPRPSL